MFFDTYTKLGEAYIRDKLAAAQPRHAAPLYGGLAGQTMVLKLDDGPALEYKFIDGKKLELIENGGTAVVCEYAALALRNMVLVTHLIPEQLHGYQLIIDTKSKLVTVFKTLFCGYIDEREVQRKIYYGYIEGEGNAPEARHGLTSRLEGKGFWWKDDDGTEMLVFHPAVIYSTFVELTNPRGGLTISAPSDYIRIDDRFFIYSRVEAEYSGTLVLDVIDVASVKKIGVRLGFDENDEVDYFIYNGVGEITGQAATFSPLTDFVGDRNTADNGYDICAGESNRPVYRPRKLHRNYSKAEVDEIIAKSCSIFEGDTMMSGSNNMDYTDYMVGKQFSVVFDDGPAWDYDITEMGKLKWRDKGTEAWHEEIYRAYEPADDLIFFTHVHTGSDPYRCVSIAVDFSNGLATVVDSQIGNKRTDNEVGNKVLFGVLECEGVKAPETRRHCFTNDLVGKSIAWTYSDSMSSVHIYSSPYSYSWSICQDNFDGGMTWSSPCLYVKLREDAYLFGWVEETCGGNQCLVVFNPRIMHDGGFFFGMFGTGLSVSSLGAYARWAGSYDIMKYFENRHGGK